MSKIVNTFITLSVLGLQACVSQPILKLNELKTSDGDNYYRQETVLESCYIRSKKDVTVTMNGIQIKACEITRSYSSVQTPSTSIYEIDCGKVNVSKIQSCH